ncbi:hypothetical protein Tco_0106698 [Tanacetum coccineum]
MKMRFVGAHMPLLPDMLAGAAKDQGERPAEPADQPPIPDLIPSPPRSHEVTPSAGQPSGVAEDPLTLTALSSLVSKFMQKTTSLESELKDTKKTLGTAIITLSGERKEIDMDSLLALANASLAEQRSSFVTPSKDNDSGESQEQDISYSTLAAAHILSQTKLHAERVAQ